MEKEEQDVFVDEGYKKTDVLGFRELFLMQVRRCLDKQSKEMREGFSVYSTTPGMSQQRTRYVGDSRDEFFNSVKALHDLTQPKFDDDMKTAAEEINEKIDEKHTELKEKQDEGSEGLGNTWRNEQVKLYRKMFQALCFFGERKHWFESTPTEE